MFEKILQSVKEQYDSVDEEEESKEKTATYRQLMGNKMQRRISYRFIKPMIWGIK